MKSLVKEVMSKATSKKTAKKPEEVVGNIAKVSKTGQLKAKDAISKII